MANTTGKTQADKVKANFRMKTPKGSTTKSSKPKTKPKAVTPKRKVQATAKAGTPVPCTCCPDCTTAGSGVLGTCEDGACSLIAPPAFFGVLSFDPARPTPLPYWERPANFPAAALTSLMAALVANMDTATKNALATALGL